MKSQWSQNLNSVRTFFLSAFDKCRSEKVVRLPNGDGEDGVIVCNFRLNKNHTTKYEAGVSASSTLFDWLHRQKSARTGSVKQRKL